MAERRAALLAVLVLGLVALARADGQRQPPAPLPCAACQSWMADSLPDVGIRRRDAVVAAIRAGQPAQLPRRSRAAAEACFTGW